MPIKTSFFGYVREFDLNGENITRDTAINSIKLKADDGYVTLIFRTIPERKVAEPRGMEVDYERCRPST